VTVMRSPTPADPDEPSPSPRLERESSDATQRTRLVVPPAATGRIDSRAGLLPTDPAADPGLDRGDLQAPPNQAGVPTAKAVSEQIPPRPPPHPIPRR